MRSVVLLAFSNLRRRAGQAMLVGSIVALSSLLFLTGVGVLREINAPIRTMMDRQRASQLVFAFDSRIHDPDSAAAWWRRQPGVDAVSPALPSIELRGSAFFRGKQLGRFLMVTERPIEALAQDDIRPIAGGGPSPGPGSVWIPTSIASETGAGVGDTLELPGADGLVPFAVSAVVVDPQFSGQFFNPVRVWVDAGSLPLAFSSTQLNRVMMAVRTTSNDSAMKQWQQFVDQLGGSFSGALLDRETIFGTYTGPYTLMAGLIVAFSALGFLVALFAIHGTMTSAILGDYKLIGIVRAKGFRPADVARSYLVQYLTIAIVALPLGVLGGVVVVRQAIALLTKAVATPVAVAPLLIQGALVLAAFLGLVALFVARVSRAAGRIRPAEAIRLGGAADQSAATAGISLSRMARLSVPMIVAVKNIGLQKRRAVFLAIAVLFATAAGALAINLDYTFSRMTLNLASFGFDDADVRISRSGRRFSIRHHELVAALRARPEVRGVATWDGIDGAFPVDSTGRNRFETGTVVDGDMAALKYANIRGRHPNGPFEMSIGVRTAIERGLDVGSRVRVYVMGAPIDFEVVGVYQSINNTGHGFRVRLEAVQTVNPLWWPSEYAIALADGTDRDQFIAAIEAEYGEAVDAKPGDFFIRDQLASIVGGLRLTNGFLAIIFLAAAAVFIVNTTLLSIGENRRVFGILKTTGMTPMQLRFSLVAGVAVQAAAGVLAGLLVWFLAAPTLLAPLFGAVGLVSFPLENSLIGMAILSGVMLTFCLGAAWIPSRQVLAINARSLIVE